MDKVARYPIDLRTYRTFSLMLLVNGVTIYKVSTYTLMRNNEPHAEWNNQTSYSIQPNPPYIQTDTAEYVLLEHQQQPVVERSTR